MGFLMNNDCLRKYASSDAGFSTEAYYIIFGISYFTMVTRDTPIIGSTLKCTVSFGHIFTTTMNCSANLNGKIIQNSTMFQHGEFHNHTTNPSLLQQTSKTKQ